ncbi:MAG: exodeoxyribonuclease VII small subunit [Nitrospirota bacterium]
MKDTSSYKAAIEELESIVGEIENESVDVDVLAQKVKRATFLINLCRKKLKTTDNEIKRILKEFEKEDET